MLLTTWHVNSVTLSVPHSLTCQQEVSPEVLCIQETETTAERSSLHYQPQPSAGSTRSEDAKSALLIKPQ